jgi:hypothetical protein
MRNGSVPIELILKPLAILGEKGEITERFMHNEHFLRTKAITIDRGWLG